MSDHPMTPEDAYSELLNDIMNNLFELEPIPGPSGCCQMHFLMSIIANLTAGVILNTTVEGEEFDALDALYRDSRERIEAMLPQKAALMATRQ